MKTKHIVLIISLVMAFLLLALAVIGAFVGIGLYKANKSEEATYIIFEPNVEDLSSVKDKDIVTAESVIAERLRMIDGGAVSRHGEYGIRVVLPDGEDTVEAIQYLGQTAALYFVNADGYIVMQGDETNIKSASMQYGPLSEYGNNEYFVQLQLTSAGKELFQAATEEAVENMASGKNYISIALDEQIISSPWVSEVIYDDTCIISGGFDRESAVEVANLINSGSLPFSLKVTEMKEGK